MELVVFYNKLLWIVSELLEKTSQTWWSSVGIVSQVVFYNKLSWFVSELPEKDISNVMVQCR
jgi:hypothetical protein